MSIYHSQDDPWDNGWANTESPSSTANLHQSTAHIGSSSYLTSSQLLGSPHSGTPLGESSGGSNAVSNSSSKVSLQNIPSSYKHVYEKIGESCSTTNELEVLVFNKLIAGNEFTQYQKSRIIDVMYDNNLLPPSREANFYQILGLIALELDVPGTGDYVTLQFRFQTLPELSDKVVKSLLGSSDSRAGVASDYSNAPSIASIDPLNAHLANTSITEDEQDDPLNRHRVGALIDPILTDHSSIQHRQEGASSADVHQHGGSSEGAPITFDEITKYVDGIKDTFKVLCGNTKDIVRIKEVPEKEGLLFKHTNYIISHELNLGLQSPAGGKKVIRRYSDFVWYVTRTSHFILVFIPFPLSVLLTIQVT